MITLYGAGSPNVVKVVLALEEIGAPYEFRFVKVFEQEQFSPAFVALNPNSKVPVIVDQEAEGGPVTIFESGAILIYLAEKFSGFLPVNGLERTSVFQWLMFQIAGVGPTFGQHNHFSVYSAEQDDLSYPRTRFLTEARRLLRVLNARLEQSEFLAGPAYTIADMATFPWVHSTTARSRGDWPAVDRWVEQVAQRSATQRTLSWLAQAKETGAESRARATSADWDRFYGLGEWAVHE